MAPRKRIRFSGKCRMSASGYLTAFVVIFFATSARGVSPAPTLFANAVTRSEPAPGVRLTSGLMICDEELFQGAGSIATGAQPARSKRTHTWKARTSGGLVLPSMPFSWSLRVKTWLEVGNGFTRKFGQAFATEATGNPRLKSVTFWTTPAGGGSGVDVAYHLHIRPTPQFPSWSLPPRPPSILAPTGKTGMGV